MNVLIVDDQLRSQMQIYLALRRRHNVQVASNEEDAFELLDKSPTDVVLLDLEYPSRHSEDIGQHLALRVRKKYPALRLIGIHNRNNALLLRTAHHLGCHELISRPIKNKLLVQIVSN